MWTLLKSKACLFYARAREIKAFKSISVPCEVSPNTDLVVNIGDQDIASYPETLEADIKTNSSNRAG